MTRINVVDVNELCDQHLFAEFRELTRIPNKLRSGKLSFDKSRIVAAYTVQTNANPYGGRGHEYFFVDKLAWLERRYTALANELVERGYFIKLLPVFDYFDWPAAFYNDYQPSHSEQKLNRVRLVEMFPARATYYGKPAMICETQDSVYFGAAKATNTVLANELPGSWIAVGVNKR